MSESFEILNDTLMKISILVYPDPNKPYILFMDVSQNACSSHLVIGYRKGSQLSE